MSIPLDRLYHYIESVAQDVYGDTLIYRFYPHGSKKIEDLNLIKPLSWVQRMTLPEVICYDQEPLNYQAYCNIEVDKILPRNGFIEQYYKTFNILTSKQNLRKNFFNIYDYSILLHSEKKSVEVEKYRKNGFIPVYYWSHALLALDWYRYAQHCTPVIRTNNTIKFLIYNRAWAGTREYRLKFLDLLIQNNLTLFCQTSFNEYDPGTATHYTQHQFSNKDFYPKNQLEKYFIPNCSDSWASADFEINDYKNSDIEVVLETLFDDSRIQLTEKILRPIACGHPFILVGPTGSLEYLKSYGFKTFDSIFNEDYDREIDPFKRQQLIIKTMTEITNWTDTQKESQLKKMHAITTYNRLHFFSKKFFHQVVTELKNNLKKGFKELENNNRSTNYIHLRIQSSKNNNLKSLLTQRNTSERSIQDLIHTLKLARTYYNRD